MSGTNPVATWGLTNYTTQDASTYKATLDGDFAVAQRIVDNFAPRQTATPAMTVSLDAGHVFSGTTLTEVTAQTTGTITAPVSHPRIDRVVVDRYTGTVSVITGTESVSPTPPAITSGKVPVAQVLLQTTSTTIINSMITDERDLASLGAPNGMTSFTNSLGSDVALNNTASYFTGPTVSQGTSGTFYASGNVNLKTVTGGSVFAVKLWDGTSVIDSAEVVQVSANSHMAVHLSGIISSPAGNIRISVMDGVNTDSKIEFNGSGNSKDSTVSAFRIG